ncbi:hypothetical protein [Mesorhizobium sp. LNHC232B00]|uniref:hypothetical protein n=1 Tax=Mesorhizobium TaxID=68287 RepID=UPI0003CE115B|nr:hypothetical protein X742_26435 [Mesorhizobium sp. LNHC232B00]
MTSLLLRLCSSRRQFFLNEITGFFEVSDDAAHLITNVTARYALDQLAYPRRRKFHAVAMATESESDFSFASDLGIHDSLLDDRRSLCVSGQALTARVAQHDDAPDF